MKRVLIVTFVLGLAAASLFAVDLKTSGWNTIVSTAKAEGQVIFYAWYFPDYFKEAAADFEKLYGIKAVVIIGDQTANFNKAIAEKNLATGTIDAMIVGGQWVKTTMDLDLFFGPIKGVLPEAHQMAPSLWELQEGVLTKGYLAPFHRNQTGILYDPNRVKNPPQTWEELVKWIDENPKEFGFCDPSKGGTGQSFVHTVIAKTTGGLERYKGDSDVVPSKVANWNLAWKWFTDRRDKLTITMSNNDSIIRLNGGEISMTVGWDDNVSDQMSKGNLFKRAKMYIPQMGLAGGGDTMGVLKNAPNKAAALLWIHFIQSKEQQLKKFQKVGAYPARIDLPLEGTLLSEQDRAKNAIAWFPAAYKNLMINEFVRNVLMK
ncbi:MAG: putative thiamine transport system substrate-binding protein [Spirochaetes bacterium]|nr:MAG: putative thiamine transport system substrate-binding protein [Spirochaetota bacterium]